MSARPFRLTPYVPPEDDEHVALAHALHVLLPPGCFWTSHELRNAKSAAEGANRKRRGCRAGFPDLTVWYRGRVYPFELKRRAGGAVSPAQKVVHAEMAAAGFPVHVCKRPEDVLDVLRREGVPLRGQVAA